MAKTIVHVNQHIIKANRKNGTTNPPLTIKSGKHRINAYDADLLGPVKVVYRPEKPLSCGAHVWIECNGLKSAHTFDQISDAAWKKLFNVKEFTS